MRNDIILQKLILYVDKILGYCTDIAYDGFAADTKLVDACVFNLSQMGELVSHLDEDFETSHPEVPWRALYGLRNRIVHDYEGVNLTLVWDIIDKDLSGLKEQLTALAEN